VKKVQGTNTGDGVNGDSALIEMTIVAVVRPCNPNQFSEYFGPST
jgi:hypothetical protein